VGVGVGAVGVGVGEGCVGEGEGSEGEGEGQPGGPYDLLVGADGFGHDGLRLTAALLDLDSGEVLRIEPTLVREGSFAILWERVLVPGTRYEVYAYVDLDDDGQCDTPPTDHAWRFALPDIQTDLIFELPPGAIDEADACLVFPAVAPRGADLLVGVDGLLAHEGRYLSVRLLDGAGERAAARQPVRQGSVLVFWEGLLFPEQSYHVEAYLDEDDDGRCQESDRTWRTTFPGTAADTIVELLVDAAEADEVCAGFKPLPFAAHDLLVGGTAFYAHEGSTVRARLSRADELLRLGETQIRSGYFEFFWDRAIGPGDGYQLDVALDEDGSGGCNGEEPAWRMVFPAPDDDLIVEVDPDEARSAEACAALAGGTP